MKQGTNSIMRVNLDYDFDTIEKIEFIFEQDDARLKFTYPSDRVLKVEDAKALDLVWTREDTYVFSTRKPVYMDTRISIVDVDTNPATSIAKFYITPTLFRREDD